MKKRIFLVFHLVFVVAFATLAQTNTFPSSGNAGVGTTSPAAKISFNNMNDGSNGADGITWYNSAPLQYGIYRTSGAWTPPGYQQLRINFETGIVLNPGSLYEKSFVQVLGGGLRVTSGSVGIGTTSPLTMLHLKPFGSTSAWISLDKNPGTEAGIHFLKTGNHLFHLYSDDVDADALKIQAVGLQGESELTPRILIPYDNKNLLFGLSGGSVAIGHRTPYSAASLHVKSFLDSRWSIITESKANDRIIGLSHDGTNGMIAVSYLGSSGFSPLQFLTSNLPRLTIDIDGNVGIATTSPNEKLTVNGTIYGKEVKVDLSVPAPDYVFEKEYDLASLEEIKKFIDEHKHLPGVPSGKMMEEDGIMTGEMSMILLKKVEEFTLYIIRQQNEINELKKMVNDE